MYGPSRNYADQYRKVGVSSRVADADPHKLVALLFEGASERIRRAEAFLAQGDQAMKGKAIGEACAIIGHLNGSLDHEAGGDETLIEDAEDIDRLMHEAIIDHLDNDIVSQAFRVTWLKIRLIRQYETRIHNSIIVPVMQDHLAIIAAIETRDPERAGAAMAAHIGNARARAMQY